MLGMARQVGTGGGRGRGGLGGGKMGVVGEEDNGVSCLINLRGRNEINLASEYKLLVGDIGLREVRS